MDSRHSAPSSSAVGRGRCLVALEAWTLRSALVMAEEEVEGSHVGGPAPARGGAVDTDTGEEEGPHRRSGAAGGATGRLVGEDDGRHRRSSPLEAAAATFPGLSCSRLSPAALGQVRAGLTGSGAALPRRLTCGRLSAIPVGQVRAGFRVYMIQVLQGFRAGSLPDSSLGQVECRSMPWVSSYSSCAVSHPTCAVSHPVQSLPTLLTLPSGHPPALLAPEPRGLLHSPSP